jgi:hypothetical protein
MRNARNVVQNFAVVHLYWCIGPKGACAPPGVQASSGREGRGARHSSSASPGAQIGAVDFRAFESRRPAKIGRPIITPRAEITRMVPEMRLRVFIGSVKNVVGLWKELIRECRCRVVRIPQDNSASSYPSVRPGSHQRMRCAIPSTTQVWMNCCALG